MKLKNKMTFLIQSALDHDGIAGWITGKNIQKKFSEYRPFFLAIVSVKSTIVSDADMFNYGQW